MQQKFSEKVLVPETTAKFTLKVSKSYALLHVKFPMVMHFCADLHSRRRSKSNIYVFSYDKIV